jgi:putative flippase GtrA
MNACVRFARYSLVGISTFLFDIVLLYVLVEYASFSVIAATILAFSAGVTLNYLVSRRFVFRETARPFVRGYAYFVLVTLGSLSVITLGMYVLVGYLSLQYLFARVCVGGVAGFCTYFINLRYNFAIRQG